MEIFSDLDPAVKILSLGISGFCFLLVIMAYKLISDEQKKENPRKVILSAIYVFMSVNFLNVIIVGLLGLPAIGRNNTLTEEKKKNEQELVLKQSQLNVLAKANDLSSYSFPQGNTDHPTVKVEEVAKHAYKYQQALDSLTEQYSKTKSPKTDSVKAFNEVLVNHLAVLRSDTAKPETKKMAAYQFYSANRKFSRFLLKN